MKQSTSSVVMTMSVCSKPQAVKGGCSEKKNACSKNTTIYGRSEGIRCLGQQPAVLWWLHTRSRLISGCGGVKAAARCSLEVWTSVAQGSGTGRNAQTEHSSRHSKVQKEAGMVCLLTWRKCPSAALR